MLSHTPKHQLSPLFSNLAEWQASLWKSFDGLFGSDLPITPVETLEENGKVLYLIDLPGVQKEDLSVTQENRLVKVEANRKGRTIRSSLSTQFTIPPRVKADTLQASLEDGVLSLTFELLEPMRTKLNEPKKIEVQSKTLKQ